MTAIAFVDETYRDPDPDAGYYQLTAALVDSNDVSLCRSTLKKVAPTGFHASPLANAGNTAAVEGMLAAVGTAVGWNMITVVTTSSVARGLKMEKHRQLCLEALLLGLEAQQCGRVVLDSRLDTRPGKNRQARNAHDLRTFGRLRTSGQLSVLSNMKHARGEPLLWAPDAVGWAYRQQRLRGIANYWAIVDGVTTVIDLGVV